MAKPAQNTESLSGGNLQPARPAIPLKPADLRSLGPVGPEELAKMAASADGDRLLGQERALDAIRLGIGIGGPGYNIYVSGLRTRHERETVLKLLAEKAATMPVPGDWVYVNNFRAPEAPVAVSLLAGEGVELRNRMQQLVEFVIEQLPKSFRREDFTQERTALRDKYNKRAQDLFSGLEARARERGFAIQSTPNGQVLFVPLIGGKMPESPEALSKEFAALPEAERERLTGVQNELQDQLAKLMVRQQDIMRELVDDIRAIERAFASRLISPTISSIKQRFNNPAVSSYLDELLEHMLSHLDRFRAAPEGRPGELPMPPRTGADSDGRFAEYQINVLVDNSGRSGAPVVSEDAPSYRNLFGAIERWIDPYGRVGTNFSRIIPGSFLKSHGGFLVFDIEDALVEPGVWKMLKRTLKTGRMTLETFEPFPFFSASGLKPEPIAISNKVIVLGSGYLYSMLYFYDSEFSGLFKVKAEIRPVVDADSKAAAQYVARVAALAKREQLPEFDGGALERIVEYGMRRAGDRTRLLSIMEPIDDLAREAAYFARAENSAGVTAGHVERALHERVLRLNFVEEEIRRL
ncbi:MAG: AAA family ATPase, partial [Candidatus Binataceae bacterium]